MNSTFPLMKLVVVRVEEAGNREESLAIIDIIRVLNDFIVEDIRSILQPFTRRSKDFVV